VAVVPPYSTTALITLVKSFVVQVHREGFVSDPITLPWANQVAKKGFLKQWEKTLACSR
jgi:hypothetical protein